MHQAWYLDTTQYYGNNNHNNYDDTIIYVKREYEL
jgi:hypothetical protein